MARQVETLLTEFCNMTEEERQELIAFNRHERSKPREAARPPKVAKVAKVAKSDKTPRAPKMPKAPPNLDRLSKEQLLKILDMWDD